MRIHSAKGYSLTSPKTSSTHCKLCSIFEQTRRRKSELEYEYAVEYDVILFDTCRGKSRSREIEIFPRRVHASGLSCANAASRRCASFYKIPATSKGSHQVNSNCRNICRVPEPIPREFAPCQPTPAPEMIILRHRDARYNHPFMLAGSFVHQNYDYSNRCAIYSIIFVLNIHIYNKINKYIKYNIIYFIYLVLVVFLYTFVLYF